MKHLVLITLALTVPFLTGCPKSQPKVPSVLAQQVANYEISRFEKDEKQYYCAMDGRLDGDTNACTGFKVNDVAEATKLRNRIIDRLKSAIDSNYHEFENQLFTGRATTNVLFDIVDFGSGVATTITNGARAKSIISAALTGFKGGRKSIDENFFRERTTAVIISQMQASRAKIETDMLKNLNDKDATGYSLDRSLGNLIDYFYAGTLQKGLQELAKETGQNAIRAEEAKEFEKGRTGVSGAERVQAIEINDRVEQLFADANNDNDPAKQTAALSAVKKAITELSGNAPPANASTAELFTSLKAGMRLANKQPGGGTARIRKALGIPTN